MRNTKKAGKEKGENISLLIEFIDSTDQNVIEITHYELKSSKIDKETSTISCDQHKPFEIKFNNLVDHGYYESSYYTQAGEFLKTKGIFGTSLDGESFDFDADCLVKFKAALGTKLELQQKMAKSSSWLTFFKNSTVDEDTSSCLAWFYKEIGKKPYSHNPRLELNEEYIDRFFPMVVASVKGNVFREIFTQDSTTGEELQTVVISIN